MLYLLKQMSFAKTFFTLILFLSPQALSKLFISLVITWNLNFAVNLVTSFSHQKPLKSKNKKHRIFWNTEFYPPAKVELKGIKNAKVVPRLQVFASCGPSVLSVNEQIHVRMFQISYGGPLTFTFFLNLTYDHCKEHSTLQFYSIISLFFR